MPPRKEVIRIKDILDAIGRIQRYLAAPMSLESFLNDEKTIDAVIRNFSVIGESASHIPSSFRKKNNQIPWEKMIGMRNFVIHEYFSISLQILWTTSHEELPSLQEKLSSLDVSLKPDGKK